MEGVAVVVGGLNIPLTLLSILGSHPAAPGEKEGGPANICDGSTPTDEIVDVHTQQFGPR